MADPVQTDAQRSAVQGTDPNIGQIVNPGTPAAPVAAAPAQPNVEGAPAQPAGQTPPASLGAPESGPTAAGASRVAPSTHGVLGEIFQTLAGGKKAVWQQTDQGPVKTYVDLKPGEMARGILAAAITGLASGYDPANRGKGPAMSSAFSAGFRGEQERTDKLEAQKEQEAQQEFKNKGIADQQMLARAKDAREQQESLERSQEYALRKKIQEQQIARGEIDDKHSMFEWNQKQELHMQNLKNLGAEVVMFGGKPLTFHSHDEAEKWITQSEANHTIAIGNHDTVFEQDPTTGDWSIYQMPKDRNRPQWLGVKIDDKGNPVLDKNGKMQVDPARPFYDMNGKPAIPAERMTPQEFYDRNEKTVDMRAKRQMQEATALELREKALDFKDKVEKTEAMKIARQHLQAVGGDLNATDKNGALILSAADRDVLKNEMRNNHSYWAMIIDSGTKEIQGMATDDPKRAEVQAAVDQARAGLANEMYTQAQYELAPDPINVIAARVRQNTLDTSTGKVDIEKAKKQLKDAGINNEVVDKVVNRITEQQKVAAATPDPKIQKATSFLKQLPEDRRYSELQATVSQGILTQEQADQLIKDLNIKRPAPAPAGKETLQEAGKAVGGAVRGEVPVVTTLPTL